MTAYVLGAAIDGDVTVRGIPAKVDVSFSDILSNLEAGLMMNYRAENERFAIAFDGIYMALGGNTPNNLATVDVDQWVAELSGSLRVSPNFELLAAARYSGLSTEIRTHGPGALNVKRSKDWIDPIVGVRGRLPLSSNWSLVTRGDIGGFGLGSDFTWQAIAYFEYSKADSFSVSAGYRIMGVDYETGEGASRYVYNVVTSGPAIGFSWRF